MHRCDDRRPTDNPTRLPDFFKCGLCTVAVLAATATEADAMLCYGTLAPWNQRPEPCEGVSWLPR